MLRAIPDAVDGSYATVSATVTAVGSFYACRMRIMLLQFMFMTHARASAAVADVVLILGDMRNARR